MYGRKSRKFYQKIKHRFCQDETQIDDVPVDNIGFKTLTTRPQNEYLNPLENDLYTLIR